MIFRSGTQVLRVQDYRQDTFSDLVFPGGRVERGAVVYPYPTSFEITSPVVGLVTGNKPLEIGSVSVPAGELLLVKSDPLTLLVYRNTVLVHTLTRQESDPPFTMTLLQDTFVFFALLSQSRFVTLLNPLPGTTFGGTPVSDNLIVRELTAPTFQGNLVYQYTDGKQIDQTYDVLYPGDELRYVSEREQPQPLGDGYQFSGAFDEVHQRFSSLDKAFVNGGLVRVTAALEGLTTPDSTELVKLGTVTYRLDDELATASFDLTLHASRNEFAWTFSIDEVQRTLKMPHGSQQHASGHPAGCAIGISQQGSAAIGMAIERTEDGLLYLYGLSEHAGPVNEMRHPNTGTWEEPQPMSYVIPGGPGTLIDRRFRIRHSAGPYFYAQAGLHAHTTRLILGGAQDASPGSFQSLLIAGRLHRYAVVGSAAFNPHLNLLLHAAAPT